MTRRRTDVLIVGAGGAGLSAAETLSRGGASVVVVEARSRIGGRIWTRRIRGWPLPVELGAEFVHGRNDALFELASSAALLVDRLPDLRLDATGDRSWKPMRDTWKRFDAITRKMRRSGRDRSVAEFLRLQRGLSPDQRRMTRGMVEGYHAASLDRASEHALSTRGDPPVDDEEESQYRVVSGYDGVPASLRSRTDPRRCRLILSSPVESIRWRRGEVRLRTTSGRRLQARRIIVTVPVGVLKHDVRAAGGIAFDPDPPELRRSLAGIEMGQVVKIVLRFREAFWEERRPGLAFFHRWGATFPTWWTAAPAEVPMLTGWSGGPKAEALLLLPRGRRLGRALEELESLFDVRAATLEKLLVGWHSHDWSGDPFARGAYSYVGVGGAGSPRALARPIADTLFFAGEATEPDENGTVPGAISSGRRAAQKILSGG
jgi:monoamine oxidase